MSIFYPDNDNRQNRLSEMTTDAGDYLHKAEAEYQNFEATVALINARIASLYQRMGAAPPALAEVDILAAANVPMTAAIPKIQIAEKVVDAVGFVAATRYLAPGLLSRATASGLISEELAASTFVLTWGGEVSVGLLISGVAAAVVAGVVIVAIGLAVDLFEGSTLRDELQRGIANMSQIRADIVLNWLRSKKLALDLGSLKTALDALESEGLLTEDLITRTIHTIVMPSISAVEAIGMDQARAELASLDQSRSSWTNEDSVPVPPPAQLPAGTDPFLIKKSPGRPPYLLANMVLCPAVPGTWETPTGDYPAIVKGDYTAWPMSFADHRNAVMLVLFDKGGNAVNEWIFPGISTVTKFHADPSTNMICLTGDNGNVVHFTWSQLAPLPPAPPLQNNLADMLKVGPAMMDFGLVHYEGVQRFLVLDNRSDADMNLTIQVVSALAADRNVPYPKNPPKPAVVSIYLQKKVHMTVPAHSVKEAMVVASWDAMESGWTVYSPSDFQGGIGVEAAGYSGAITTQLQGAMNGGATKPGVGAHVTVNPADIPPFEFVS